MTTDERLTGFVQGIPAKTTEERFARALNKLNKRYIFTYRVQPPTQIPGQENEIDFLVEDIWPIEVDGLWVHKTGVQKNKDRLRDQILDNYLNQFGFMPIKRIPATWETQEEADIEARELF